MPRFRSLVHQPNQNKISHFKISTLFSSDIWQISQVKVTTQPCLTQSAFAILAMFYSDKDIKLFWCSCLKGFNHLSDLGVKRVFSMESLSCQTTCKSHLYLASHLPTSFLQILLNCGESQQGSVWDSQEGAKLACICKLPWELLHHTAQGREALNLHLGECQEGGLRLTWFVAMPN